MNRYILFILVILTLNQCQMTAQPINKEETMKEAIYLVEKDRKGKDKAISLLNKVIKAYPNDAEAYYYRGEAYYLKSGIYEIDTSIAKKAITNYKQAIVLNPKYLEAYTSLISLYSELEQHDLVLKNSDIGLQYFPNNTYLLSEKIAVYIHLDNHEKALEYCDKILAIDSINYSIHIYKGIIYKKLKEYNKALPNYTTAIKYGKKGIEAEIRDLILFGYYDQRASLFEEMGKVGMAYGEYERMKKKFPKKRAYCNELLKDLLSIHGVIPIEPEKWLTD